MTGQQHRHSHDPDTEQSQTLSSALATELREHVPFSVSAVVLGLIVAGAICITGLGGDAADGGAESAELFFHLFHPAHMFFSAAATTAMFFAYDRRMFKAVLVGLVGAIGVCGISDIVMPHCSLVLLGKDPGWHICIIEHPGIAIPFAMIGVFVGLGAAVGVSRSTLFSHSCHVFASTMASIFYMVGPLGMLAWIDDIGQVFLFVVVAVMVPCCLSDIVFPLLMTSRARQEYQKHGHSH